jgi:hypothetical protein
MLIMLLATKLNKIGILTYFTQTALQMRTSCYAQWQILDSMKEKKQSLLSKSKVAHAALQSEINEVHII